MIKAILASLVISSGVMSQYGPGVMQRVVVNQQRAGRIPEKLPSTDGFVALPECEEVGRIVFMRPEGEKEWSSFLVADCASKTDFQSSTDPRSGYQWMITEGIVAEADHRTAVRWNTEGRGVEVQITESIPIVLFSHLKLMELEK